MQQIKKWTVGEELLHKHGETVRECTEHAVASDAKLNFAKLNYAELNYAELNGAELNFAKLNGAELNFAKLNFAKLNYAELNYAKLNYAELNYAKLSDAKLNYAELNGAELNGAELNGAKLNYAELNGADIENTSFVHSDMRFCSRDENAKLAHLNVCEWPVSIQFDGVHIGCKRFSLEEILAMTEEIAATHNSKAPVRWRRWGKAIQALAQATLG